MRPAGWSRAVLTAAIIGAVIVFGLVVRESRYGILLALIGGERDPEVAFRLVFLAETATAVLFAGALVLHLFVRRWWSIVALVVSISGMTTAVAINFPRRRGGFHRKVEFIEDFGALVGDTTLAQALYNATYHATFVVLIAAAVSAIWAVGLRHFDRWNTPRPPGSRLRPGQVALWLYPIALVAVLLWNAQLISGQFAA